MSTVQRRFALMLGAALAMLAFAAPVASATFSPNPSFPNGDFDPENWVSVDVEDTASETPCNEAWPSYCSFNGNGVLHWEDQITGAPHGWADVCDVALKGTISQTGEFAVGSVPSWSSGMTGYPVCSTNPPLFDPYYQVQYGGWSGAICASKTTGEVWLRLYVVLKRGAGALHGEVFGKLVSEDDPSDGLSEVGTPVSFLEFDHTLFNHLYASKNFETTWTTEQDIDLGTEVTVTEDSEEEPCAWPELQA